MDDNGNIDELFESRTIATEDDKESENFGTLTFDHLEYGTYQITETKAPEGYNLSTDVLTVVINSSEVNISLTAKDKAKFELPITGANGKQTILLIGIVIFIVGLYVKNSKMNVTNVIKKDKTNTNLRRGKKTRIGNSINKSDYKF